MVPGILEPNWLVWGRDSLGHLLVVGGVHIPTNTVLQAEFKAACEVLKAPIHVCNANNVWIQGDLGSILELRKIKYQKIKTR